MRAQNAARNAGYGRVALAAAPPLAALALAYLASVAIDVGVPHIGWFDRAWFGWTIVMPLLLVAPGLAGLVRFGGGAQHARLVIAVVSLFVAAFATYRLTVTLSQIGCQVVTDRMQAVPVSLAIGVTGGIAFAVAASGAGWAASRSMRPGARVAAVLGAGAVLGFGGGIATLLVYATLLPAVSCAVRP